MRLVGGKNIQIKSGSCQTTLTTAKRLNFSASSDVSLIRCCTRTFLVYQQRKQNNHNFCNYYSFQAINFLITLIVAIKKSLINTLLTHMWDQVYHGRSLLPYSVLGVWNSRPTRYSIAISDPNSTLRALIHLLVWKKRRPEWHLRSASGVFANAVAFVQHYLNF